MALNPIANGMGFQMDYCNIYSTGTVANNTINASGESVTQIGRIYLEGGSGSKTLSSAGGKITFRTGTVTFANAGSNFRIGVQDVASTGIETGTFDVYADSVGGGGGIISNTWHEKAMASGSKTITHGDLIAISFEMTSYGGSDSVIISSFTNGYMGNVNQLFPYKTADTGSGPVRNATSPIIACIVFDDGTLGWIEPQPIFPNMNLITTTSLSSSTTPDEYAAVFQVPFKCSIRAAYMYVGSVANADDFEIILYSDAEGTPTVEQAVSVSADIIGSTSTNAPYWVNFTSEILLPGIRYAIALRPTTTNTITLGYHNLTSTFGNKYKKMLPFGSLLKMCSRTNQTGAFSEVQSYYLPAFGILIDALDDGVCAGGGSSPFAYVS
ncbi:MAG: hypothetical protein IT245_07325 [Bacteroidia bacterium]|nr:hypothetical protein [Bacteroidia bacterium]